MKNKRFKSVAVIAAMALTVSSLTVVPACADDYSTYEYYDEVLFDGDVYGGTYNQAASAYSDAQKTAYDMMTAACDGFLKSDVNLSTDVFQIVSLNSPLTVTEIGQVVSDIKSSGNYQVLSRIGLYSSASNAYFDKVTLFTDKEYRTADGRESLTIRPEIIVQPNDVTAAIGDKVSFTVSAEGEGLTYQWQCSSNNGQSWYNSTYPGYATNTMTMTATEARCGLVYRCVIKDKAGNTVTTQTVKLIKAASAITVKAQPSDVTAAIGDKVSFTVSAEGEGLTYQWQCSSNNGQSWYNSTYPGYATNTMTMTATEARCGLVYRCVIRDKAGNTVTTRTVKLIKK